jgi:hypothetical protein
LTIDRSGTLYGTASTASYYSGSVFRLTPLDGAKTKWRFEVLHDFGDPDTKNDGQFPKANVALDRFGNIYGTTYKGGKYSKGSVFRIGK